MKAKCGGKAASERHEQRSQQQIITGVSLHHACSLGAASWFNTVSVKSVTSQEVSHYAAHTFNSSIQKTETGRSLRVRGKTDRQSELQESQGCYTKEPPSHKTNQNKKKPVTTHPIVAEWLSINFVSLLSGPRRRKPCLPLVLLRSIRSAAREGGMLTLP